MDRYVPLPPLPARISRLNDLAYDLWWSWNAEAREVFRDLDYPLWRFTDHNPVLLLHRGPRRRPRRRRHVVVAPRRGQRRHARLRGAVVLAAPGAARRLRRRGCR